MTDSADREAFDVTARTPDRAASTPAGRPAWSRERESFSCTDQAWDEAKAAWGSVRRDYLTWALWLETALANKTAAVKAELNTEVLEPAPERLPTGRRTAAAAPIRRKRRAFTCAPDVWKQARAAWWVQLELYPALSDWIEEAIVEMTDTTHRQP
ncbi:hypothetical protein [Rhodococcus sp. H29-C3]|uniref:hypothetical protein n=1 Tax=Rhodococcus sp. H29-C3 TaxID=3046307 RepID=UPI0024B9F19F|nr:hypothetical protein [Rhodococcus sp. H29-C3]MDJ0363113.1 hypothetical protein [Rhodococcus sp. H29-C3]